MHEEYCDYCESEVLVEWDELKYGYITKCPKCGACLKLCNACANSYESKFFDCDDMWGLCFRDKETRLLGRGLRIEYHRS